MAHFHKSLLVKTIVFFCILLFFSACVKEKDIISLPTPIDNCNIKPDWHGLIPGQSTREDVINVLGMPAEKGKLKFEDRRISYYAYSVNNGEISKYAMDRIFFRPDGLIDWMEIVQADRNGRFEAVFDTAEQVGNNIDTVYSNNNYRPISTSEFRDTKGWPDQIYVWAGCGLAIDALPSAYSPLLQVENSECQINEGGNNVTLDKCNLISKYPSPTFFGGERGPDPNSIVLMKFYFQPTSYKGFTTYYMYKLPYGLWDEYLVNNK